MMWFLEKKGKKAEYCIEAEKRIFRILITGCSTVPTHGFFLEKGYEGNCWCFENKDYLLKIKSKKDNRYISISINGEEVTLGDENASRLKVINKFIEKYEYLLDEEKKVFLPFEQRKKEREAKVIELVNKFITS